MARKQRNTVDYFPFICKEGETLFCLEETYGNDGFAVFIKILRSLATTEYHYIDLSSTRTKMFLAAKCKVSKDILESIIQDLVELRKFDSELWDKGSIIWCQDFIDNIQDAYKKRSNNCITKSQLKELLGSKGIPKPSKSIPNQSLFPLKVSENTHSIVEDSIKKDSKEDKKKEEKVYSKEVHNCYRVCLNQFPENLHPKNKKDVSNWLETIEKLNRLDNLSFDWIGKITEGIRKDDFWSKNFLALPKLRKKNKDGVMYIVVFYEHLKAKNGQGQTGQVSSEDMQDYLRRQREGSN